MKKNNKLWFLVIVLVFNLLCGCTKSNAMKFDSSKNFYLEFGRGSSLDGLDTIEIKETGDVSLNRLRKEKKDNSFLLYWEKTSLSLKSSAYKQIASQIKELEIYRLQSKINTKVKDGSQWEILLKQGEQEKYICFSNSFPISIKKFADFIDNELKNAGADKAKWVRVQNNEGKNH